MARIPAVLLIVLVGCAQTAKKEPEPKEPPAPDPLEYALFDGKSGKKIDLATVVARAEGVDFLAFGELHRHPAGSLVQKELLEAMVEQTRPVTLAMEFFERDTQGVLDRYLDYELEEADFMKWCRQAKSYAKSHRPLIEICKDKEYAVIAANAPRRLATEFRKSAAEYAEFLELITPAERSYLPRAWSDMEGEERERFFEAMGGHETDKTSTFTRSMALWDDAMAEACADVREKNGETRVVLMVGTFHVARGAQTVRKYRERRPDDAVLTLVMSFGELAFSADDEGKGDFVMKVHPPKPKKVVAKAVAKPAAKPAKNP